MIIAPPLRLYLIRHGETDYNLNRRFQGHSDQPLNDRGIRQAELLARRLKEFPIARIVSSDVHRAAMTAGILAEHLKIPLDYEPLWRERDPGELTHRPYEDGLAFFSDPDFTPPGGESAQAFDARIRKAASKLASDAAEFRHVAVVTHGMACASFLKQHFNLRPNDDPGFRWRNTSLTIADHDGAWSLQVLSDASHLDADSSMDSPPPVIGG